MRTRDHNWLNMKTMKPAFGIDVFHDGEWKGYAEDGKAYFAKTEQQRSAKRAELRKRR